MRASGPSSAFGRFLDIDIVQSASENGTSLHFVFQFKAARLEGVEASPSAVTHSPSPGKILVADDDASFRRVFATLLRRAGYECHEAADGDSAMALIKMAHPPFDTLIADIHMPGNTQLELVHDLARSQWALPVILLTGVPELDTAVKSVRLRVVEYVIKPPNMDEVRRMLREAVHLGRQLRDLNQVRGALDSWGKDLDRIEAVMHASPEKSSVLAEFLLLLVENLQSSVTELSHVAESIRPAHMGPDQSALRQALRETITVLDKTRTSFRSKTLGELRLKLSRLVEDGAAGEP